MTATYSGERPLPSILRILTPEEIIWSIRTLLKNFTDYIEIDITSIGIGGKILVKDILTDRYRIQHPNDTLILSIKSSREVEKISKTEETKSNNEWGTVVVSN